LSITGVLMLMPLVDTTLQSTVTAEQRTKLRSLIALTRTVAGINNAGRPTLRKSSIRNKYNPGPKSSRTFNDILLDATATILVRNQEVIALAASGGSIIAMEGRTEETTAGKSSPASQETYVSAAESDFDGGGDSSNLAFRMSHIAKIINPRKEDNYNFPAGSHFMALRGGKSHLKLIQDENKAWEWFLNIS
jgi:hypothetical protein